MEAIFPISALQKDSASVRREAETNLVRLTVDGHGKYVFATEDVLEEYVQNKVDEALYQQRIADALEQAVADEHEGRLVDAATSMQRIRSKVAKHAES
ncbi:MAG: hypothetical protein ACI4B6_03330 [Atopobiaceae bacterium]